MLRFTTLIIFLTLLCGCKSKQTPLADPPRPLLPGIAMAGRTPEGKQVTLQDGSIWAIQPVGQNSTMGWAPGDQVEPRRETHPKYEFVLINHSRNNFARAHLLAAPGMPSQPMMPPPLIQ